MSSFSQHGALIYNGITHKKAWLHHAFAGASTGFVACGALAPGITVAQRIMAVGIGAVLLMIAGVDYHKLGASTQKQNKTPAP